MKKEDKITSISTFLGFGSLIEGSVEFQGTIRLDGRVNGKISSKGGTLIVGERAVVQADIIVDTIIIMGEVSGTIDAKERIEVTRRDVSAATFRRVSFPSSPVVFLTASAP